MKHFLAKAFNLEILQKSRLAWVDYLKGIAIILVVYRHALLGIERGGIVINASLENANMIFYSFRMPLFFVLSGIFIGGSLLKKQPGAVIQNKFNTLLYPYLVWTFIQITLQVVLSRFVNASRSWVDYTYILYQPRSLDQFWYLPALFNTTLVYVLLKTKLKTPHWLQLLLGLAFYFTARYVESISMISDWMKFYIFFAIGDAIARLFFTDSVQRVLQQKRSLLLFAPFFALAQWYYVSHTVGEALFLVIALTGCVFMFMIAFQLQRLQWMPFLRVLGFHSIYIYAMHVIVIGLLRVVLIRFAGIHQPLVLLTLCITGGVFIPVIIYNCLINRGPLWFLFSPRKPGAVKKDSRETTAPVLAS
ncbi:acyltransferase family protein [Deminuibacter soli]|uniref:Acyltransferase n=1 Tax=Deminuibacter soli TaxID=2291815 RepID=A0A3E1NQK0_9BACT|nr:acyltransferase [Deminuibacter soli]RFM30190.1 acyltransferase [Deminuibacter soli]